MKFSQQIVFIFVLLALQGKSFSHARQAKEVTVTVVTSEKELAELEGESNVSLQKEILPSEAEVQTSVRIGGRKMSLETTTNASKEQGRNSKKEVSMASSSSAVINASVAYRKGDEEENWKDNFMALSADYRSPKPHPPKNN